MFSNSNPIRRKLNYSRTLDPHQRPFWSTWIRIRIQIWKHHGSTEERKNKFPINIFKNHENFIWQNKYKKMNLRILFQLELLCYIPIERFSYFFFNWWKCVHCAASWTRKRRNKKYISWRPYAEMIFVFTSRTFLSSGQLVLDKNVASSSPVKSANASFLTRFFARLCVLTFFYRSLSGCYGVISRGGGHSTAKEAGVNIYLTLDFLYNFLNFFLT